MKASVVIPVYNKSPYLRECLDSVFDQTFSEFELIAVDDRSTDDSLEILRSYTDPRLKVIALAKNSGPGLAAQAGHDAATGEYIIRCDADDVQHPERFARQIAFMDEHPEIGVSGSPMRLLNAGALRTRPLEKETLRAMLVFGVPVFQPTMILRRSVLVEHGVRYDPSWPFYGEDWLLKLRLFPHTQYGNLPECLVSYREGGISQGRKTEDLHYLYRHVFRTFGLGEPTQEQLDIHCYAIKHFRLPPVADSVKAFRQWLDTLERWNERTGLFHPVAFHDLLEDAWHGLFHYLMPYGPGPVWAYLRAGGKLDPKRFYYMIRTLRLLRPLRSTSATRRTPQMFEKSS